MLLGSDTPDLFLVELLDRPLGPFVLHLEVAQPKLSSETTEVQQGAPIEFWTTLPQQPRLLLARFGVFLEQCSCLLWFERPEQEQAQSVLVAHDA